MADLLKKYEEMQKQAEAEREVQERVEVLVKYATAAEQMLADEFGDKYTEDDVIKLASFLIDHDLETMEEQEKVAEYDQLGRIMAQAFVDELNKLES